MASKADIDQWIAAQGGPDAVVYGREEVEVDNPAKDVVNAKRLGIPPDPTGPDKIRTLRETWTNKATGAKFGATRTPYKDDDFYDLKEEPGTRTAPSAGTNPAQTPGGATRQPSGMPTAYDAQGRPIAWDNSQPVWVWTDQNGKVVKVEQLNPGEREDWERGRNEAAGKGRKTDKELEAAAGASSSQPVPTHPGYTQHTTRRRNPTTGVDETETFYTDAQGNRVNSLPEKPQTAKPEKDANGNWGYWDTKPGQSPVWVPIQGGPNAQASPTPTQVNGQWGTWKPGQNGAAPTWEPMAQQPGAINLPPDAPVIDTTDANTAHSSYMALLAYIDKKVRAGEMTPEQAKAAMAAPQAQVASILDREKQRIDQERQSRQDQMTLARDAETRRNNRAVMSSSMFSNAASTANAAKVRGDLTPSYIALQAGLNQASGAYNEYPDVAAIGIGKPPPPAAAGPNAIGVPTAPPGVVTPGAPPDGAAVEAARQKAEAKRRAAMANPAFRPTLPVQNAGAGTGEPPARGSVPPQPQAPASAPKPTTAGGVERPDDVLTVRNRVNGTTVQMSREGWDRLGASQSDWSVENAESGSLYTNTGGFYVKKDGTPPPASSPTLPALGKPGAVPPGQTADPSSELGRPGDPGYVDPNLPVPVVYPPSRGDGSQSMTSGGWSAPMQEEEALQQSNVAAVGSFGRPISMADREQEWLTEGFSENEIAEARRRFLARQGMVA